MHVTFHTKKKKKHERWEEGEKGFTHIGKLVRCQSFSLVITHRRRVMKHGNIQRVQRGCVFEGIRGVRPSPSFDI